FLNGQCDTGFIDHTPELFDITPREDHEVKVLQYIGNKVVNERKGVKRDYDVPRVPKIPEHPKLSGTKLILDRKGPQGVVDWVKAQNKLLLSDTTMRDAHQSLTATRIRTVDMLRIAEATAYYGQELFSLEMWGGATFDVAYRFLHESPWERLEQLRQKIPNIMLQMLLRGANAVGYTNYPDNVVRAFIREAAAAGIDVFRIFDSLNWLKGMEVAIDETLKTGRLAEACVCYTGDILDDRRDKYSLDYYVRTAKDLEKMGAHILGIKDMAGLLKPYAAVKLIRALKQEISIPIHLHTHDTSGNGVATVLMAAEAGVDIADTAFNSMAGTTSQPALNSVVAALENTHRSTGINLDKIQEIADYWDDVRPIYSQFESDLKSGTAEVYKYEIPGGQYSNLKPQVESFGLGHKFKEVKEMYKAVNDMLGDIVKVTPSSKLVGDLAIFMVKNDLTPENILEKGKTMSFPDSAVSYFEGMMGQPFGGFPQELQKLILKDRQPITARPGELLAPIDFIAVEKHLKENFCLEASMQDILSYALYSRVFEEYLLFRKDFGDLSRMNSPVFFDGINEGEICEVEVGEGKTFIIKLVNIGKINKEGERKVYFEVNGNPREFTVLDTQFQKKFEVEIGTTAMADPHDKRQVGASIPGTVTKILVKPGDTVQPGQSLVTIEAMKMETQITAPIAGTVINVVVSQDQQVKNGELLMQLE
ncbi:MAG: pyruvate carboxylase, partial [Syntrophomonas sp.]|nr:pyruvate carboxylase [Syntrophomonas sp.]